MRRGVEHHGGCAARRAWHLRRALLRFRSEDRGSLTIFALVLFMLMVMMGGLAIDLMRYETTRTTLQNTLDRSTLAAASLTQALDPESVVEDYFDKAGLTKFLRLVTVSQGMNFREVKAGARADTKPYFLHLLGISSFDAAARSTAEQRVNNVEIMLVLDVSGSMAGTKLTNLKTAAKEFVDTMLASDSEHSMSIGIVPYNAQVNLGPVLRGKYLNATKLHGVANVNCLELPDSVYADSMMSTTTPLPMMAYADASSSTDLNNNAVSPTGSKAVPNYSSAYCQPTTVNIVRLPAQNIATLQSQIGGLVAGGNTSIMLGMKWGLSLLDPGARPMYKELIAEGQIPATLTDRPFSYTDAKALKVIVLMTDGEHVSHDRITDPYKAGPSPIYKSIADGNYSVYHPGVTGTNKYWVPHLGTWQATPWNSVTGVAQQNNVVQMNWEDIWANLRLSYVAWQFYARALGTTSNGRNSVYNTMMAEMEATYASVTKMNSQLQQTCTLAKNNGVIVFGIAFEAPTNGQAQISACASSPAHYFNAQGLQIQSAFRAIATNLSQLRLTQ